MSLPYRLALLLPIIHRRPQWPYQRPRLLPRILLRHCQQQLLSLLHYNPYSHLFLHLLLVQVLF
jgi:hypothetical protein